MTVLSDAASERPCIQLSRMHVKGFRTIDRHSAIFLIFIASGLLQHSFAYDEGNLLHVQSFQGQVGMGNFTYYRLTLEGLVVIRLTSTAGDADLYISSSSLKPTWEAYDLKSSSCGIDEVVIEPNEERPVGIGVYGYKDETNSFHMSVYVDPTYKDPYPESDSSEKYASLADDKLPPVSPGKIIFNNPKDNEESLLWTIFVGFMKILVDILI